MPRLLDLALCQALEARWRDQGAEIVDALRPGLGDEEMDRLASDVGITLPWQTSTLGWAPGRDCFRPQTGATIQLIIGNIDGALALCSSSSHTQVAATTRPTT
jgi:hypothetical protein